jgi:hypothetical protein
MIAQLLAQVPARTQDDDMPLEMPTLEQFLQALHLLHCHLALTAECPKPTGVQNLYQSPEIWQAFFSTRARLVLAT